MDTYVINLSDGFAPFEGEDTLQIKKFAFKGGDLHLQLLNKDSEVFREHHFEGDEARVMLTSQMRGGDDLLNVLLANDAIRRLGVTQVALFAPYFPAARQDRVCNVGEPFTVKVFANIINACKFEKVFTITPHSDVTPAVLDNLAIPHEFDKNVLVGIIDGLEHGKDINIISPDAGSGKRTFELAQKLSESFPNNNFHFIRCDKIRDVKTGKLKEFAVHAEDLGGFPSIIVDDVIAMGGTFIGLAEILRKRNVGKLYLYTTHADCQEGLDNVSNHFDGVFTTNSHGNFLDRENVRVIPINEDLFD